MQHSMQECKLLISLLFLPFAVSKADFSKAHCLLLCCVSNIVQLLKLTMPSCLHYIKEKPSGYCQKLFGEMEDFTTRGQSTQETGSYQSPCGDLGPEELEREKSLHMWLEKEENWKKRMSQTDKEIEEQLQLAFNTKEQKQLEEAKKQQEEKEKERRGRKC
ncbi:hypothetical protein PAMP_013827 [Pampus punctatissimus]